MAESKRPYRVTVLISGSGSNLQAILDATSSDSAGLLADCKVTSVISSRSDAYGLTRARSTTPTPTPAEAFPLLRWKKLPGNESKSRQDWERQLAQKITATRPDVVVLAGWMLILGPDFLKQLTRDWDEDEGSEGDSTSTATTPCVDPTGERVGAGLATPGASPYTISNSSSLRGLPIPIINLHPALPGQFPGAHAIKDAYEAFLSSRITHTGLMIHRVIPELDAGEPVVVKEVPIREGDTLEDLEERIHKVEHEAIVQAVRKVVDLCKTGEWWNATAGATNEAVEGEDRRIL
ncbi:hypothetical protein JCM10908_003548 [Rhodotorula pacifica]|uniref:phosphoribosylglycinamide formyltransferase n=1 Tax=Rhodotorula pacifica TaxID=1495444 RepID=UPI0031726EEB